MAAEPVRKSEHEEKPLEDTVVKIYRCAKVVKGGRRFSFAALVASTAGNVALAAPSGAWRREGMKDAKKSMHVCRCQRTIPHQVIGRFGTTKVVLVPAPAWYGVIAVERGRARIYRRSRCVDEVYGSMAAKNGWPRSMDC